MGRFSVPIHYDSLVNYDNGLGSTHVTATSFVQMQNIFVISHIYLVK